MPSRFIDKPSPTYLKAIAALEELREVEGWDHVMRATAEVVQEELKDSYHESTTLKESAVYPCACALAGKKHPRGWDGERYCLTEKLPGSDHLSGWKEGRVLKRIVSQPYGLGYETLKQIIQFCEKYGLEVWIDAYCSWHFPGYTLRLEWQRKPTPHITV